MGTSPDPRHEMAKSIMGKWGQSTAGRNGCFVQHLDADLQNNAPSNLADVHPADLFEAMSAGDPCSAVDWSAGLTEEEVEFVMGNAWNFCETYKAESKSGAVAGSDPVAELTAMGDAAMEEGDFDRAVELYERAKETRARLVAQLRSPRYGRRASPENGGRGSHSARTAPMPRDGPVICVATPSRRRNPPGKPTPKEAAEARIAARQ